MNTCDSSLGKIKAVWYVCGKYNYRYKVAKALEQKNFKYINMLIKKGKIEIIKN